MNKLTFRAIPVKQGETSFYLTSMKAGNLTDKDYFKVDRWDAGSHEGYQREVNQSHAHRLARYLGKAYMKGNDITGRDPSASKSHLDEAAFTNVLPSSIVINFRKPFKVTKIDEGGEVEIEVEDWPAYIIDGQHRITAAREVIDAGEEIEDYEFPVTITQFSVEEEMIHFRNLNSTANRPPKGLNQAISHQLFAKYGKSPASYTDVAINRATGVTMRLASDVDSIWYGKIALGGIRKRSQHTTVQSQFTESIKPLFTRGRYSDPAESLDVAFETIKNFWKAVDETWPTAAASMETSIIMRAQGMFALNRVMERVFNNVTINPTYEDFVEILSNISTNLNLTDASFARPNGALEQLLRGYSWSKGVLIVADYIWSGLDEATRNKIVKK